MVINQVTVFLENKTGRLNEVTRILGMAGIDISAFTIADTSDFGILRMIVSDPLKAREVLRENSFSVQITEVVLVKCPNRPGGMANMLEVLHNEDVFIEYMYAFSMNDDAAVIVIRPANTQKCMEILLKHKDEFLYSDNRYQF